MNRRQFLAAGALLTVAAVLPRRALPAATSAGPRRLVAGTDRVELVGGGYPPTRVWCYDGRVPGPALRVTRGERLEVEVANDLPGSTTVHWHGIRLPNAMDGVPHLTQPPIEPGERFVYAFDLPDAGTYLYHSHYNGMEQLGRGLSGPLIVEEPEPPEVDRDVLWFLDDWRLDAEGRIVDDFGDLHDLSHAGRLGNTVTLNGNLPRHFLDGETGEGFSVRAGERIRLRLINAANARIFALSFEGHAPTVIAIDGHPVEPHEPKGGRVVIGPGMRVDLVLDLIGTPGTRHRVVDDFQPRGEYMLVELAYEDTAPLRESPPDAAIRLAPNPLPEPALDDAEHHRLVFGGGMMGAMGEALLEGERVGVRDLLLEHGKMWALNDVVRVGESQEPFLELERGSTCVLEMHNETAWHHPIHLHGHAFRVLARNGEATRHREWQDTVMMDPHERVDIAFQADNPGDWLLHCHIQEHHAGGMGGVVRVR